MFENSREIANEVTYNVFRFAITGKKDGPNILKTCLVMGNKEVQKRL